MPSFILEYRLPATLCFPYLTEFLRLRLSAYFRDFMATNKTSLREKLKQL